MDVEAVIIELAKKQGELGAYERMFTSLNGKVAAIDEKLDQLLIREGERKGETRTVKRFAIISATVIPMLIALAGVVVAYNVG
jgi:hypothetical protein